MRKFCVVGVCAVWAALGAPVEDGPRKAPEFVTDRPDFSESPEVAGAGLVQLEIGVTLDREGATRHLSNPELLVRTGLNRRMELRFGGEGMLADRPNGGSWKRGMSDSEIGLKVKLWDQGRIAPALAILPLLSMPTGGKAFSSGNYEPTIKFAAAKDLPHGFGLGGNLNFSSLAGEAGRYSQRAVSLSLSRDLIAGFGGYAEVYTVSRWDEQGRSAWIANTGLTHSVGKDAQIDVRIGKRISAAGPDWFAGVGFAIRRQAPRLFR